MATDVMKPEPSDARSPRRIVIVGGGAGGAELAARLGRRSRREGLDVTLVDSAATHVWKPRLHEVAAGLTGPEETTYLALAHANGFRFRLGALKALDLGAGRITIDAVADPAGGPLIAERTASFDILVLAFGSMVNDFGVPGVEAHCHRLDSGAQAIGFQRALLSAAVRALDGGGPLRIGIAGAGATGVELAVELHHAIESLRLYGALGAAPRSEITLVDMGSRVLPALSEPVSRFASQALERAGVKIRLNVGVARVTAEGFELKNGDRVACDLKVWASGVIGRPLAEQLAGLTLGRGRRIVCDGQLRCEGAPNVFALGDCAEVMDPATGRPLPATAQVAHQQAAYLARWLARSGAGQAPEYRYRPQGSLVAVGSGRATGEIPAPVSRRRLTLGGVLPRYLYVLLDVMHRAVLFGWIRAVAGVLANRLRRINTPPVKLH